MARTRPFTGRAEPYYLTMLGKSVQRCGCPATPFPLRLYILCEWKPRGTEGVPMDLLQKLALGLFGPAMRENVLMPALARVGTALTVWLVAQGVADDLARQVALGVVAVGLIAWDFVISWLNRRNVVVKAVNKEVAKAVSKERVGQSLTGV